MTLISQGAEALIYRTEHPYTDKQAILKERPKKSYRHEVLDKQLTKHRTLAEARILHKLLTCNVRAPRLIFVDARKGLIWMEYIEGKSLKELIWSQAPESHDIGRILYQTGVEIAKMHSAGIVHGDLTTSNIMVEKDPADPAGAYRPVMIDFGLSSHSTVPEDRGVDLYVLERAIESTHPEQSNGIRQQIMQGYSDNVDNASETLKKLELVRMRGRKRTMVG